MNRLLKKIELQWGLPIFLKDMEDNTLRSYGTFLESESPFLYSKELVETLMEKAKKQEGPVIYKDQEQFYFLCIKSKQKYYMSGPICIQKLNRVEIHRFYKNYQMLKSEEKHPPVMGLVKLANFASLLYELIEGKDIECEIVMEENNLIQEQKTEVLEKEMTQMEQEKIDEKFYHHTYQEERYVMDCVREGNVKEALERMDAIMENLGVLSKNKFNDQRNTAIVAVAMYTREVIAGGVSPAKAYKLSDFYINNIDECTKIDQITELLHSSMRDFCELVARIKKQKYASSYTEQCKDYILQNYHHKIYLEEIASAIGISQGHLSRVFYQDTGMHVQEYIMKFRVERATNLLKYSEASLPEISDYVCFNSQSHFGSVFKQYMQMTPGEYRRKYKCKEFQTKK